jgi:hypothetical protein
VSSTAADALRRRRRWSDRELVAILGCVGASLLVGLLVANASYVRYALAAGFCALIVGAGLRAPRALLLSLAVWLTALGLLRRFVTLAFASARMDPLLVVEPLAFLIVLATANGLGAFRRRTELSVGVIVLSALVVVAALNPLQPSLSAGAVSLIFFAPLVAFWIGRILSDDTFRRILWLYALLALPVAVYGMVQVLAGFPSWDASWVAHSGYDSLQVLGAVRPFSTFSSSAEYAMFLEVAILAWLLVGRRRSRALALVAPVGLFAALVYTSSRGPILSLALAGGLLLAAWKRLPGFGALALAVVFVGIVPLLASQVLPSSSSSQAGLVQHQLQGLANPFDPSKSTALLHVRLMFNGMKRAFSDPAGGGLSQVTIAAQKYGGTQTGGETDPSNAATAMGLPGLLAYLWVLVLGLGAAYRFASRRRDAIALAALGVLMATFPQWLNGGLYADAWLPWLALGWLDGAQLRSREAEAPAE